MTGEGTVIVNKLLNGVLCVPTVRKNLFSVGICTSRGYLVAFREKDALILRGDEIVARAVKQNNAIFRLLFQTRVRSQVGEVNVSTTSLKSGTNASDT